MGACAGIQPKSKFPTNLKNVSSHELKSSSQLQAQKINAQQQRKLQLIYDDLAGRSPNGQMTSRTFENFFKLNKVWGGSLFRKFSNYYNSTTLKKNQFVQTIQRYFNASSHVRIKFLFSLYNMQGNKGISYLQFVAILIGLPKQAMNILLSQQKFIQSLPVNEIAYILSQSQHRHQTPEHILKLILKQYQQQTVQDDFESQKHNCKLKRTKSADVKAYIRQQIKQYIKDIKCSSHLAKKFADFIFNEYKINEQTQQISYSSLQNILEKYPAIMDACTSGFHQYLWRYQNGQPLLNKQQEIASSKCFYLNKTTKKQKKVYLKFVKTSWLIYEDKTEQQLKEIINLQGLRIQSNIQFQGQQTNCGLRLSHRNGIYPEKVFFFPTKQIYQKWMDLTQQYQHLDFQQKYLQLQLIDNGTFGHVYRCQNIQAGSFYAVKIINAYMLSQNQRASINYELQMLKICNQLQILQIVDKFETKKYLYIVTQLLKDGNLYDYVGKKKGKCLNQVQAKQIMRQLLITVQKLHEFGIIHRDLKPNNIMLRISEKEIVPVVIDFGLATYKINLANEKDERKFSGTANFVAPQIYQKIDYDQKVDVFSLGVNLYFMLCGYLPFQSIDLTIIRQNVQACQLKFIHTKWKKVSSQAKNLLRKMICFKQNRFSCEQALKHEWFNSQNQDVLNQSF